MNEAPLDLRGRVMENALAQANEQCLENYINSCIAKGGDLVTVAKEVRQTIAGNQPVFCFV